MAGAMSVYRAFAERAHSAGDAGEEIRALLVRAQTWDGGVVYGDGTHLGPDGMHMLVPHLEVLVENFAVDAVLSDSTLCSVDPWTWARDYQGGIVRAGLSVLARPFWGHGFVGSGCFRADIEWVLAEHPDLRRLLLLCAGNDCHAKADAAAIAREIDSLVSELAARGVTLILVEVVPPSYQHF